MPTARYVDDREEVEFGELFFYAGRDYILTVRYGHAAPLSGVRSELEEHPEQLAHGPGAVLQAALLHVVQSYVPVIDGLENDVREVERDVFSESRDQPTKRIYFLIREVLDFLVALEPMSASLKTLTSTSCMQWVHPEIVPLFRDVDEALAEIVERGRAVHSLLQNALTASRTEASLRQNEDTRKISAWVAIGVVPTVVAGLFGMNLGGIPGRRPLARLRDRRARSTFARLRAPLPQVQGRPTGCSRQTTSNVQRGPGDAASRASAVNKGSDRSSARATYSAS